MPKETKRNHYSPKFANRPWANRNGLMYRLRPDAEGNLERSKTGPVEWGQESYLYPQDLEDALSVIETKVAPIYRSLQEGNEIGLGQRLLWSHWLLCQYSRTPTYILDVAKIEEDVLASFALPTKHLNTESMLAEAVNNIASMTTANEIVPFIAVRDWIVCRAAEGSFFLRTDQPVFVSGPLVRDETQIVYPLAPETCFVATIASGRFPPGSMLVEHQLSYEQSVDLCKNIAMRADREAVVHPDHVENAVLTELPSVFGKQPKSFVLGSIPDLRKE